MGFVDWNMREGVRMHVPPHVYFPVRREGFTPNAQI